MKLTLFALIVALSIASPGEAQQALTCGIWNGSATVDKNLVAYGYAMAASNLRVFVEFARKQGRTIQQPPELFPASGFESAVSQIDQYCAKNENVRLDHAFLILIKGPAQTK